MTVSRVVRVCHVITGLERGGAETMLAKLCETRPGSVQYSVVALRSGGPLAHRIRESGTPVLEAGIAPSKIPTPAAVGRLRRLIRSHQPDVVQGWMYHGNLAALALSPRAVPVVWNVRQTLYDLRRERLLTRLVIQSLAPLSSRPAAILYNSSVSARQHERIGYNHERTLIIPNGFDVARFAPSPEARREMRAELGLFIDAPLVGLVARNHPMKDHDTFFTMALRVLERLPTTSFLVAGQGATADGLRGRVPEGLQARLHCLGPRDDMANVMASLDVACLTSAWGEGFPNVIGEAMACGVPCVTTDVGDAGLVVGDSGTVVPVADVAGLTRGVMDLLSDAERRRALGAKARERIVSEFSIARVARRYATLYADVAERGARGDT